MPEELSPAENNGDNEWVRPDCHQPEMNHPSSHELPHTIGCLSMHIGTVVRGRQAAERFKDLLAKTLKLHP